MTSKGGRVGLMSVAKDGHIGSKSGPANSVAIFSNQYKEMPLVISGPGAGPEIKVAGVIEDMLQVSGILQNRPLSTNL
jgi:homoserine dehydrogenase